MAKVEITNKLLKEAIADADAVRQTAIENAKLSLEETFTPQIKSMLSRRLRAEAEGMEHDEEEKDVETKDVEKKEAPAASANPKMETVKELPFQDGEADGSSEMPADSSTIGTGDNKEPSDDAFASADDDMSGEDAGESDTDWYDDWSDADFDLDEVIKELENDLKDVSHDEKEKKDEKEKMADEAYHTEDSEDDTAKPKIPAKTSTIGAEAADKAANVNTFVTEPSDVNKMEGEKGMNGHKEEPEDEEELDLESILAELEAEDEKHKASSEKMAFLQKELAEYREAVKLLRGRLQEVNLLNAKLLYTNKIFRKEGLSTEQKVMVVENFDRATTVREIKMVYTVLVETLTSAARVVKATKASNKVVSEGFASKVTSGTAPKIKAPEVIAENSVAKRLQQLAGIIS